MSNMKSFIYLITNPKGRYYIGSTNNTEKRWNYYKKLLCKGQIRLYNSLKKYGYENHTFEILKTCDFEDTYKYEYLLGHEYNVLDLYKGLNCRLPKYGENPICMSADTKKKISIANKNSYTDEKRKIQSESMKGDKHFMFGKEGSMKGKKHTLETRLKLSKYNKNRTDEHKKKLSDSHKGKVFSLETKIKMSNSAKGKVRTKEHQDKLNESRRINKLLKDIK